MHWFSLDSLVLIRDFGYIGLFIIIFAESGLFFGFFFPGDSLLFTAGVLAAQGSLDIYILLPLLCIAAVLGDSAGYAFGKKVGPAIFKRQDSLLFHKKHIERAKLFYERYGAKTIILARFTPVVRSFAPILAGVGNMRYATFLFYNVIGGLLWSVGLTLLGFFLGRAIPDIDRYLLFILAIIIVASIAPSLIQIWREYKKNRA